MSCLGPTIRIRTRQKGRRIPLWRTVQSDGDSPTTTGWSWLADVVHETSGVPPIRLYDLLTTPVGYRHNFFVPFLFFTCTKSTLCLFYRSWLCHYRRSHRFRSEWRTPRNCYAAAWLMEGSSATCGRVG